ncbi:MAG: prepilin-type N-terminal cleavage/methylation domain-containing protein [Chitinispirillaceae bacterium]|jgi:prepilin-type N-terminal cleavage/methylation domain-containing protein|nr:prepilin-type N-terminal cleavage/methylation domain-containing protein [Chitinispirillaceae bacterium]
MNRAKKNAGFTLAELIVAMALLAILSGMVWSFFDFASRQVSLRGKRAAEFDDATALLESIATNVRDSRGTLLLDESRWVFLNARNDTSAYEFSGGVLKYNRLVLRCGGKSPASFSFTCAGNDSLLDRNADGEVGYRELDQNGNGRIDGPETGDIAWVTASLTLPSASHKAFSIVAAMKNNVRYDIEATGKYF